LVEENRFIFSSFNMSSGVRESRLADDRWKKVSEKINKITFKVSILCD
jgi:hypothetical protein